MKLIKLKVGDASADQMMDKLKDLLKRSGIKFTPYKKVFYSGVKVGAFSIAAGSEFSNKYTIYVGGQERLNSESVEKIVDYIVAHK